MASAIKTLQLPEGGHIDIYADKIIVLDGDFSQTIYGRFDVNTQAINGFVLEKYSKPIFDEPTLKIGLFYNKIDGTYKLTRTVRLEDNDGGDYEFLDNDIVAHVVGHVTYGVGTVRFYQIRDDKLVMNDNDYIVDGVGDVDPSILQYVTRICKMPDGRLVLLSASSEAKGYCNRRDHSHRGDLVQIIRPTYDSKTDTISISTLFRFTRSGHYLHPDAPSKNYANGFDNIDFYDMRLDHDGIILSYVERATYGSPVKREITTSTLRIKDPWSGSKRRLALLARRAYWINF